MSEELPARIAVVHDWLVDYAGSERVLAEILRCLPQADLFALLDHMPAGARAPLGARRAHTTFLQGMPGIASHLGWYLPLMPAAIEQLDLTGYGLVISSSHAVAKGVIVSPDALHLSYVHSPMRYAWDQQFEYLRSERAESGLKGLLLRGAAAPPADVGQALGGRRGPFAAEFGLLAAAHRQGLPARRRSSIRGRTEFYVPGGRPGEMREDYS